MPRSVPTRPRGTKLRHRKGRFHFLGCGPQSEIKRRATPVIAVGPNPAAMRFDDRLTNCQAHAAALRLRRKECVEYLVVLAWGRPGPWVMNRNLDLAVPTQLRLHREHAARVLHRLDTVEHEVHQYLLKLHPVRRDFGKIGGKVSTNRNAIPIGLASQHRDHFADDLIYRD